MKKGPRRHHNTKGFRQIKRGRTAKQLMDMCRRIFGKKSCVPEGDNIRIKKEK